MLTIGGMLGTEEDRRRLHESPLRDLFYIRLGIADEPYEIKVPLLTGKGRIFLDQAMPALEDWQLTQFELPEELVCAYRQIYRYMPVYAELVF